MDVPAILAIIGGIALLVGLFGGGIKAKEIEVPKMPRWSRVLSGLIGLVLIGAAIGLSYLTPKPLAETTVRPATVITSEKPKAVAIPPTETPMPRVLADTPTTIPIDTPPPTLTSAPTRTPTPMTISSKPQILFDDDPRDGSLTFDSTLAEARVPEHPDYVFAGDLAREIRKVYVLDSVTDGPITAESLANYRVLVLNPGKWYRSQEAETIENFVRSGGGLLVLGGQSGLNQLLDPIGVRFIGAPIEQRGKAGEDFVVTITSTDPLFEGIPDLTMHVPSVMEVDDSSGVILWTDENTWLDSNLNQIQDGYEKQGPFPLVAKIRYGQGRVVVLANNPIWAFGFSNDYLLVLNALEWSLSK